MKVSCQLSSNLLQQKLSKCVEKERALTFSEDELYRCENEFRHSQGILGPPLKMSIIMSKQKVLNAHRFEPRAELFSHKTNDGDAATLSPIEKRSLISQGHINRMLQPVNLRQTGNGFRPKTGGDGGFPNFIKTNGFFSPLPLPLQTETKGFGSDQEPTTTTGGRELPQEVELTLPDEEQVDEGAPGKIIIGQEIKSAHHSLSPSRDGSPVDRFKSRSTERKKENEVLKELKYLRDTQRSIFGNPAVAQLLNDNTLSQKTLLSKFTLLENNLNRLIRQQINQQGPSKTAEDRPDSRGQIGSILSTANREIKQLLFELKRLIDTTNMHEVLKSAVPLRIQLEPGLPHYMKL